MPLTEAGSESSDQQSQADQQASIEQGKQQQKVADTITTMTSTEGNEAKRVVPDINEDPEAYWAETPCTD